MFRKKDKIFCIGCNKTGTTSVERALLDLGFKLGSQKEGQDLIENYKVRDFKSIINFCKKADAFQDAPFSWHYTFIHLDQAFENAKFILTVRNNEEEWYDSFVKFQTKLFGKDGQLPSVKDLSISKRSRTRSVWDNFKVRYELDENNPYDKKTHIDYYLRHNEMVKDYFRFKKNLLIINLKEDNSYQEFCKFLGVQPIYDTFPWENKTRL